MFKISALNISKDIIVQECFLDSVHVTGGKTGKHIAEHLLEMLDKHKIKIKKCRGQSYDESSSMSSNNKGAQSYIKKLQPKAAYTHCRNHILNLAIANACKKSSIQIFKRH